jgi:high affinity Mn2+ porin
LWTPREVSASARQLPKPATGHNWLSSDSRQARDYFAAGGLGTLIGDGRLPRYDPEHVLEVFYSAALPYVTLTADYQFVVNPGYNGDRGPVSILGVRLHSEF